MYSLPLILFYYVRTPRKTANVRYVHHLPCNNEQDLQELVHTTSVRVFI